jgi:hypothetical protein
MLPEALPTPRDPFPDDNQPRRPTGPPLPEPVPGLDVDAFAVEWQLVTSGDLGR